MTSSNSTLKRVNGDSDKTLTAVNNIIEGDKVEGDKIKIGNVQASNVAMGKGAKVIVNNIQQAISAIDEMEKGVQVAERRLAEAIKRKISRYEGLTTANAFDERKNPYKALLEYKLEDAPFFYGRLAAIANMREKMRQSQLTVLMSDSGSGKTSLLQAGLASRLLANGDFPLYLRPYDTLPNQAIKKAFLPDYDTQPDLTRFHDDMMTLRGFLERVTSYLGGQTMFIFLDQFEEFFTILHSDHEQFVSQLQECINSDLPVRWVLSLRKEFFSELRIFESINPFNNHYFLPTFNEKEACEVVVKPATLKGVTYENGLASRILEDIRQQSNRASPVQIQLVCYTLFEELGKELADKSKLAQAPTKLPESADNPDLHQITNELYEQKRGRGEGLPGAQGILNNHLASVLDNELSQKERKVAGRILEALVNSNGQRAIVGKTDLQNTTESKNTSMVEHIIDVLYKNRLLRRELDEEDNPLYELAHDYLLTEIELDPETKARKAVQELLRQAMPGWESRGRLLSESDLQMVNALQDRVQFNDKETIIIYASSVRHDSKEDIAYWRRKIAAEAKSVLLTLIQSDQYSVRLAAVGKLVEFQDDAVADELAMLAVKDKNNEVREAATLSIAQSNHLHAIKQIIEMASQPNTEAHAETSLVTIRDRQTAVSDMLSPALAKRIQRRVWRRRWQNNKYKCYAVAWRGAFGGFGGFGVGMGIIIAMKSAELTSSSSGFSMTFLGILSLLLVGMILSGTISGIATMGGGFARAYSHFIFDGSIKRRSWIISSSITGILIGLSMILLLQIGGGSEGRRYFQEFLAGFLIGFVITAISMRPTRLRSFFHSIITIIFGVVIFLIIGWFELLFNSTPLLLIIAGITTSIGFFWAFNRPLPERVHQI